jgi:hypothetical protein
VETSLSTNAVTLGTGFLYGLALTCIGVFLAGAGHGTYLLLGIASAPISFLGIGFSFVGPPLLWSTVGALLPYTREQSIRQVFAIALLLHYVSLAFVPLFDIYAEAKYFYKVWTTHPLMVVVGLGLYLMGQVMIWLYWFIAARESDSLVRD